MELRITKLPEFLAGGGEMGELMRTRDWSQTTLGPVADWPQSLKTCIRIILTSRQPMFVWWGKDLINLYNDPYKAILGRKHPEVLGQPAQLVWKEIWDQVGPRAATAMQTNEGTYDEALLLIMERNGYPEETYYTFSYSPVPGDFGGTSGIICANTDDTQRIIGERELRTLKDLGKNITAATSANDVYTKTIATLKDNPQDFPFACIYHIEEDQRIARLAGKTTESLATSVLPDYISFDSTVAANWLMNEALLSDKPMIVNSLRRKYGNLPSGPWQLSPDTALVIPITQNGQQKSYSILVVGISPHRQLDEKYYGFFHLVKDQVASSLASVYAYEDACKQAEALLEIDKTKTAFFSNISHEFRTPLTLMLGPLEELLAQKNGALSKEQEAQLAAMHRNALRLLRLVNTLLDFSRIEADRMKGHFFPVNLTALTIDLASSFRAAIENAGLKYTVNCSALTSTAYIDKDMWEKIIFNLLSNAFKYTLEGEISVSLEQPDDTAVLKVKDTGVGIPASELPHMFERFHRIRHTRGRTYEGTGIGLSLVKELVQLHQGIITIESEEGKGSTFTVVIPLGKAHLPETSAGDEEDKTDYTSSQSDLYVKEALHLLHDQDTNDTRIISQTEIGKARILLVDDNADMRHYLERLLNKHYVVDTAAHGKQALEKIRQQVPELVISDIMMPEMDGIELLHRIKQNPETASLPVILLSARAGEETKIEGYEIGADDYLIKPFSSRELLARVKAQIRMSRLHQDAVDILQQGADELEKKVKERTAELQRKNNELEQFAYIASHDLQEPLRKIRTFSELLQKSLEEGTPVNHYFDKIQSSAARMTNLIKDVLNYSRLSNIDESFTDVDLNVILQNVKTDLELLIEQKKATISNQSLPVVKGIPSQLQQLFANLISNSLKFCDINPHISINASLLSKDEIQLYPELHDDTSYIKLAFTDNGIGFEQQFSERIFAIFQRLNERKAYAGTGIGLALCKKIVGNHNGVIRAEGMLNKGAIFTIILPGSM
jgi:signal transduction histidine kinase